jgi:single-stranded DNA-binding protein
VVVGRLQQRAWTAEDGSARSNVEVVAEELGPSLRWATTTTARATNSQDQELVLLQATFALSMSGRLAQTG